MSDNILRPRFRASAVLIPAWPSWPAAFVSNVGQRVLLLQLTVLLIPIQRVFRRQAIITFGEFKRQHWLASPHILGESTAKLLAALPKLLVSTEQASAVFQTTINDRQLRDLNRCLTKFQINTPQRIRHFLAQTGHESGGLRWMEELASGEAYEGRRDLGNFRPGDGKLFKGAGVIQLTGRYNYTAFAEYYGDQKILQFGAKYVARTYPFSSAGFWWKLNRINSLIDKGATCRQVSARVNGRDPANGLKDRISYFTRACRVI